MFRYDTWVSAVAAMAVRSLQIRVRFHRLCVCGRVVTQVAQCRRVFNPWLQVVTEQSKILVTQMRKEGTRSECMYYGI